MPMPRNFEDDSENTLYWVCGDSFDDERNMDDEEEFVDHLGILV